MLCIEISLSNFTLKNNYCKEVHQIKLVITEKPSVAMSIAKILEARSRKEGYMEGGGWLVSWCIGHLVELAPADAYDPRYSK